MSHLVNTEQSQEFLCRALAVLLVSIQNSCWNDEFMLVCLLKKGKFSIGVLWLKTYLKINVLWTIFYLFRSNHNPVKWAFFPNCSWGNKAIQIFSPVEIWILILFHFEGLCCLPHLGRSTASRFCSQIPGLQLWFLSFTWSPNLLNLSVSQFPYLLSVGGLLIVSVPNNLECLALPVHLISIAILLLHCHWIYKPSSPSVPPPSNVVKNYSPKC